MGKKYTNNGARTVDEFSSGLINFGFLYEGKAAAKLNALKVQEENELQMARELMGSGPPGSIDGMIPSSKDDFEKLSKAITEKVQMFNQSKHYNDFLEGLVKDLALDRKCKKCY